MFSLLLISDGFSIEALINDHCEHCAFHNDSTNTFSHHFNHLLDSKQCCLVV